MFCLSFCHFHFNFHSHAAHAVRAVICLFFVCVFGFCFAHHIRCCYRPLANCFRSTILIVIVIDAIFRFGACLSMSAKAKANEPRITVYYKPHLPYKCGPFTANVAATRLLIRCCYCRLIVIDMTAAYWLFSASFRVLHHVACPAPFSMRSFNKVRFNFALQ